MWRALRSYGTCVLAGCALMGACGQSTRSSIGTPSSGGGGGIAGATGVAGTSIINPSAGTGGVSMPSFTCYTNNAVTAPLVRLSIADIDATLTERFGEGPTLTHRIANYERGFYRDITPQFFGALRDVAVERATASVPDGTAIKLCDGEQAQDIICAETWLADWGQRLYRRPLSDQQVDAYVAQFRSVARERSAVEAARNALVSMLLSPYFALRIELSDAPNGEIIGPYELAARISHFAARMSPDDALMESARSGELAKPTEALTQYERLSQTPAGLRARAQWVMDWLELGEQTPPASVSPELYADMLQQLRALVTDAYTTQGGTLDALFTSARLPVNQRLAEHYGFPPQSGEGFAPATLEPRLAAGVLASGAFLSRYPRPTQRGVAIVTDLVGGNVPSPPANIDPTLGPGASPRERIQSAVSVNPQCVACHNVFDPSGFALDAFDDQGRFTDFDSSGSLPLATGTLALQSPADLGRTLSASNELRAIAVRRLLELALDRPVNDKVNGGGGPKSPLPPDAPAPIPNLPNDPDAEWLSCLSQAAATLRPLNLAEIEKTIVLSQGFRQHALPLRRTAVFDVSTDPVQHALNEVSGFMGASPAQDDNAILGAYHDALQQLLQLGPPMGSGGDAAGGDASGGAAGAPVPLGGVGGAP